MLVVKSSGGIQNTWVAFLFSSPNFFPFTRKCISPYWVLFVVTYIFINVCNLAFPLQGFAKASPGGIWTWQGIGGRDGRVAVSECHFALTASLGSPSQDIRTWILQYLHKSKAYFKEFEWLKLIRPPWAEGYADVKHLRNWDPTGSPRLLFFPAFPPSLLPFQAGKKPRSRFDAVIHTNTGSVFVNGICSLNGIGRRWSASIGYSAYWNPHRNSACLPIRQGRIPFSEAFARIGTNEPAPRSTEALQIFQCLTHR